MTDTLPWQSRDFRSHMEEVEKTLLKNEQQVFIQPFVQRASEAKGPLAGAVVSVKATFDVKGQQTTAGSKLLGLQPAQQDAAAVTHLKQAGASIIGHTNMTELAYSGVGLNPHYGTPSNPLNLERIPGGSTSGGAVSVATGLADIALGTDTGGSLRIPAAFCGLTGFKPSQSSVSRAGCAPLSDSLDSVGPIARDVATCRLAWQIVSNTPATQMATRPLTLVVPENFGLDSLDDSVKSGFETVIAHMQAKGFSVKKMPLELFEDYKTLPVWQFSAIESRHHYDRLFDLASEQLDPRVSKRIARGIKVSEQEFEHTCQQRQQLIAQFREQFANTVFLLPTVACCAPKFTDFATDEDFDRINLLCLRNTTFANVVDGCSISLPFSHQNEPMGLMLTAMSGQDHTLLELAARIEPLLTALR
ncbi:Glutamyl-tRNA(Gln) amidotransferase subunit A [Marinomonas aquimarina]|uniref:Glutamyl-tRNA(Gln) amidotransferase subunit A n=1 Tax=Marinomonas aquimarina TaxID=295068 RepID=A0A1A8THU7_9GAMM|nr:amidase family protein [Marinomonas aquimarina]SBS33171.1 Glutamyl-tRNA(Gln) amidotransferase subunit A [Marinomonas aquimarina]